MNAPMQATLTDQCDACGARAYVRATFAGGKGDLLFCAHHFAQHEPALVFSAIAIQDLRYLLDEEK